MNKNIIKLFAILMMCFLLGSVLVACGNTNEGEEDIFTVEIKNGNWFINGVDTGVKAEGKDGQQGLPGQNGADLTDKCENEKHDYNIYNGEHVEANILVANGNKWEIKSHAHDCVPSIVEGAGKQATCTEGGYDVFTCDCPRGTLWVCVDCGEARFEWTEERTWQGNFVDALGHAYADKETEPTCTKKGFVTSTCANCGDVKKTETDKPLANHVAGEKEYVKFEGNSLGITCPCEWNSPWIKTCTECGVQVEDGNDGTNKDHVYEKYEDCEQGVVPDCEWIEGTTKAYCKNCNCLEHIDYIYPGTAPGHKEQEYTSIVLDGDKIKASFECVDCGELVEREFNTANYVDTKAATCGTDGYEKVVFKYTVNGTEYTKELKNTVISKDTVPHTEVAIGEATDKTCTTDGLSGGKKCSACGKILEEQEVDKALGHNNGQEIAGTNRELSIIEVSGVKYDAYWCDVCKHWVAYQKHVED